MKARSRLDKGSTKAPKNTNLPETGAGEAAHEAHPHLKGECVDFERAVEARQHLSA
jgi:hypothetical protein